MRVHHVVVDSKTYVKAISAIVDEIIKAYEKQDPVNMTRLKNDVAKVYKLPSMPKVRTVAYILYIALLYSPSYNPQLVDIISAIPEEYRDELLPYLKAKPVRTASGIAVVTKTRVDQLKRLGHNVDKVCRPSIYRS
ncbi:hypothetical protein DYB28_002496 [Aphanomyces astaci]|uniref:ELP3-like N-terminal domain-containing protein n=2 Tax=Aphanomyces astaci TaxID=112090 RepID=A0A397CBA7_APHAT|nr:hypothetical protein DYB25_004406 [Aphanomyces astaci]RHY39069.1 hypothetical protein DYB38_003829 [Aphanomyces astaci]RHY42402.1 hypothetical protein DYB30_006704 [Aphanomyces astaci]RHY56461.1 hypothetical protein DYB34_003667 [Aphanomyces astaci]RHZ39683.1 hypothetical protein DYB26_014748 [Aphanomyces astaci]